MELKNSWAKQKITRHQWRFWGLQFSILQLPTFKAGIKWSPMMKCIIEIIAPP